MGVDVFLGGVVVFFGCVVICFDLIGVGGFEVRCGRY